MAERVVIVESPAKVGTLRRILGKKFRFGASMGHVRDLPKDEMGVDIEDGFRPTYEILPEKRQVVRELQKLVEKAREVYLATDPDREGEAIAWHLTQALGLKNPLRVEFNEITPSAVRVAFEHPRGIDQRRVDAQQARRILDRLVGYELSPLLWKKIHKQGLSAGRVQSVALRMICEREREIEQFVPQEYWTIYATLSPQEEDAPFVAVHPYLKRERLKLKNEEAAQEVVRATQDAQWRVARVKKARRRRKPRPPLITSTLQQRAAQRFGFTANQTMRIAQRLYEGVELGDEGAVGLITYMRTDSVRVSKDAQEAARQFISERYGAEYLPAKPPQYKSRASAQEAHEAIRPTDVARTPESLAPYLSPDELRIYRLVWEHFVASQMVPAVYDAVTADIQAGEYIFRATGARIVFPGYMVVTGMERVREAVGGEEREGDEGEEGGLPELREGQVLDLRKLEPKQRFTQPPPRYTEATLVRALEEHGIGRPSTYAPTIEVLKRRGYVELEKKRFVPTPLGFAVNDRLVEHFGDIVNTTFTAQMEEKLDSIERGEGDWRALLSEFYSSFRQTLERARKEMQEGRVEPEKTGELCPKCGKPLVVRRSRWGKFVGCSGYPECDYIKGSQKQQRQAQETGELCPRCGKPLVVRKSRRGEFVGCSGYPECRYIKPHRREPEPTDVVCDKCGRPMVKRWGRFGPFLGCSGFPECRNIIRLPKEQAQAAEQEEQAEE